MQPNTEMCRQYIIIEFRPIYSKKIFDFTLFAIKLCKDLIYSIANNLLISLYKAPSRPLPPVPLNCPTSFSMENRRAS